MVHLIFVILKFPKIGIVPTILKVQKGRILKKILKIFERNSILFLGPLSLRDSI